MDIWEQFSGISKGTYICRLIHVYVPVCVCNAFSDYYLMNICALVRNFSCVVPGSWWELHCRWWLDQVRCLKTSGNSCTGMLRTNVLLSDPFIYSEHVYSTHSRCLLGQTPSPVCESNLFQVLMKCTYTKWCTDKGSSLAQQIWQSNYFKGHCWIVFAIAALAENCFWIHSVSQFPSCDRFFVDLWLVYFMKC